MITLDEIYNECLEFGYNAGDDMTFFEFNEICENLGVEASEHIMEQMLEKYNINIG